MNLTDVIEGLVEERGLPREQVIEAVCEGMLVAYKKKFPNMDIEVSFDKRRGSPEITVKKEVVSTVEDEDRQVSVRKARILKPSIQLGESISVPLGEGIGRIEILAAKQIITSKIRELEQLAVAKEFEAKTGTVISGMAHKHERAGLVVKIGDVMALLPRSNSIPEENIRVGHPVRTLLKEVLAVPRGGYQLILDRASADFVQRLLELEIPEIYEGIVEIKKIVRIPGYKTKVIVATTSSEVDPVGTCVGVEGVRIKPILKELGGEKIDLIADTESLETLVKYSLKPAEIDKVDIRNDGSAMVWLAQDQRSLAIGKLGRNIALASKISGIDIHLQEATNSTSHEGFAFEPEDKKTKRPKSASGGNKKKHAAHSRQRPFEE